MSLFKKIGDAVSHSIITVITLPTIIVSSILLLFGCIIGIAFVALVYVSIIVFDVVDKFTDKSN